MTKRVRKGTLPPELPGWRGARRRWEWGWPVPRILAWLAKKHPGLGYGGSRLTKSGLHHHRKVYGWPDRRARQTEITAAARQDRKDPKARIYRCWCGGRSPNRPVHEACERRTPAQAANGWTMGGSIYSDAATTRVRSDGRSEAA